MARKDNYDNLTQHQPTYNETMNLLPVAKTKYDEALLGENEKDGSDYNNNKNMELEEDATRTIR
eukprot:11585410-Ditylum_brightwellii.AAC.1